jgi:F-type H+-transporting ATPase subunit b
LKSKSTGSAKRIGLAILIISSCWVANAWAADGFEFTRETYDLMMKWVNFIILAALIIKYARRPIANFLKEKKDEVAAGIKKLENQKKSIQEKLQESQRQLTASEERLVSIKNRIIADGENRKAQIIADAQNESRIMLETAQLRIDHQIREMHSHLKSELIDTATRMALTKLPGILTAADQDRLIHQWMDAVQN